MQDIGLPGLAEAMSDIWELIKKCYDPPNSKRAADMAIEIDKKYNNKFVQDLLLMCIKHIELEERCS